MRNKKTTNNTELLEFLVDVSRNTKVHRGGRRFSFSTLVVVGNKNGRIGYGYGKASEVMEAKAKAASEAKRKMVLIPLKHGRTLYHEIEAKFCSSKVLLKPASPGKGIIAGGPLRMMFYALGISDVVAKSIGSRNPKNVLKAAFVGLSLIKSPRSIAHHRRKTIQDIYNTKF